MKGGGGARACGLGRALERGGGGVEESGSHRGGRPRRLGWGGDRRECRISEWRGGNGGMVETAEGWAAGGQLKPEGRLSGWGITGSFVGSLWGLLASFGGAVCVSGWFVAWGLGYGGAFGRICWLLHSTRLPFFSRFWSPVFR